MLHVCLDMSLYILCTPSFLVHTYFFFLSYVGVGNIIVMEKSMIFYACTCVVEEWTGWRMKQCVIISNLCLGSCIRNGLSYKMERMSVKS